MGALADSVVAAFDSNAEIVWSAEGLAEARASFSVNGVQTTVTFTSVSRREWQVGFDVKGNQPATQIAHSSIRIFSGVFQAVREFLEVRQPERLVFASKEEALGRLYEAYLQRQDTALAELGYEMQTPSRVDPVTEFVIQKKTPSAWVG